MALLIISGEIDLSVAAIIGSCLDADGRWRCRWVSARWGSVWQSGIACRASSAAPSTAFSSPGSELPSIVVTIGTMSLFRGISYIILGDQAYKGYPDGLRLFRPGLCLVGLLVRTRALHRRWRSPSLLRVASHELWPAGLRDRQQSDFAAQFSGVRVDRVKFILFLPDRPHEPASPPLPDHLPSRLNATVDRPRLRSWKSMTMVVLGGVVDPWRLRQHRRRRASPPSSWVW